MARPKLGESETERLHVKITADEINSIDDWRYANRIPSRSEAVRRLCQIAVHLDNVIPKIMQQTKELMEADISVMNADGLFASEDYFRSSNAAHRQLFREAAIMGEIWLALRKGETVEGSVAFVKQVEKRIDALFEKAQSSSTEK